jgi:hypothetical protein
MSVSFQSTDSTSILLGVRGAGHRVGKVIAIAKVGGLHHRYERLAA